MLSAENRLEVGRLAVLLREDALEPEESKRLVEIIRHHPQARRLLVEHLYLESNLREAIPSLEGFSESKLRSPAIFQSVVAGLAVAAVVALLLVVKPLWFEESADAGLLAVAGGTLDSAGIAVVSKTREVIWGGGTTVPIERLENGAPIPPGVMEVEAGAVQIDFYSGATIVLTGPARLLLESAEKGRLEHGALWAHVPPPARGFRIETSQFDVVDLGTEFGMRVARNGQGEVHVLEGEVEVITTKGESADQDRLLKTGEGVRVEIGGAQVEIPADRVGFAGPQAFSIGVKSRFEAWKKYQQDLARDPDLLVAYTFPGAASWERTLVNRAKAGPKGTDGAVVGCEWAEGRWPGKGALAYSNSSHRVRLNLPGEYEELTMACWLKVDKLMPHVAILHPEAGEGPFVHWSLVRTQTKSALLHFSESEGPRLEARNHYHCPTNIFGAAGSDFGEWMHLTVVYDPRSRLVTHYQNGVEIGRNSIEHSRLIGFGTVDIGNWPYKEWAAGTEFEVRNLNGSIDEFLIFKRALSPKEIKELWRVGQP